MSREAQAIWTSVYPELGTHQRALDAPTGSPESTYRVDHRPKHTHTHAHAHTHTHTPLMLLKKENPKEGKSEKRNRKNDIVCLWAHPCS